MYPEEDRAERAVETRKSKLPIALQDKMLSELNDLLSVLTERLNPILTPVEESPMKDPSDRAPELPKSEMQRTLDDHNSRLRRAISKATSLLDRLEV